MPIRERAITTKKGEECDSRNLPNVNVAGPSAGRTLHLISPPRKPGGLLETADRLKVQFDLLLKPVGKQFL